MVMVMMAISLVIVTGLSGYSTGNAKLNQRNSDYYTTVSASEAATEKVLTSMNSDFRDYGDGYVISRLDNYRKLVPKATESPEWGTFDFMNLAGQVDRTEIQYTSLAGFAPLGGTYGALGAFKNRFRILSNARSHSSMDGVVAAVYQDIELARIPIFQYAIFYNVTLEIEPGADMIITGPVHGNTNIFLSPDSATLTFNSALTASGTISTSGSGTINYNPLYPPVSGTSVLSLPIGTNNSPDAVQQVLMVPPPVGENPLSSAGQQRYYNKADIIILVSNTTVAAKSGLWNNFATIVPTNQVLSFITTTNQFYNKRELKTIKVIDINVAQLVQYNATNTLFRPFLPLTNIATVYITDFRTMAATNESGVRVINGTNLPPLGLTVATSVPLYVQGDYNVTIAGLGSTNTIGTKPASFAADAITVLSPAWKDTNAVIAKTMSSRVASDTTVNAAFLMGTVETTGLSYSGGAENFPRFLENWSGKTFTYNGSMVCMFFSKIATGLWLGTGTTYDIYNPPTRKWALDQNFSYSDRLPPSTPSLAFISRAAWRMPTAFTTNVMAGF